MKILSLKTLPLIFLLTLLMMMHIPASAQYESGYYCYQCPVCGTVFQLTAYEAANTNPYTLCPACGMAYAAYFIQVPCLGYAEAQGYSSTDSNGSYHGLNQPGDTMGNQSGEDTTTGPSINDTETGQQSANTETSQTNSHASNQPNNLATKGKILMIVAPKDYQERELNIPRDYFRSNGYAVKVTSKSVRTATSMGGETTPIDLDLKDAKVSDFSAIVFVGGDGILYQNLNEDKDYTNLAKAAAAQKKLIGAICLGPWILADAGVLNGKKAAAAETDHIKSQGAIVVDESVVKDGNIITGNGPDAAPEFARAIIDALESGSARPRSQSSASSAVASPPKYKCTKCSYIYDPAVGDPNQNIPPGTPFEKLPSTWKCPWCGASKSDFVKA